MRRNVQEGSAIGLKQGLAHATGGRLLAPNGPSEQHWQGGSWAEAGATGQHAQGVPSHSAPVAIVVLKGHQGAPSEGQLGAVAGLCARDDAGGHPGARLRHASSCEAQVALQEGPGGAAGVAALAEVGLVEHIPAHHAGVSAMPAGEGLHVGIQRGQQAGIAHLREPRVGQPARGEVALGCKEGWASGAQVLPWALKQRQGDSEVERCSSLQRVLQVGQKGAGLHEPVEVVQRELDVVHASCSAIAQLCAGEAAAVVAALPVRHSIAGCGGNVGAALDVSSLPGVHWVCCSATQGRAHHLATALQVRHVLQVALDGPRCGHGVGGSYSCSHCAQQQGGKHLSDLKCTDQVHSSKMKLIHKVIHNGSMRTRQGSLLLQNAANYGNKGGVPPRTAAVPH